MQIFNKQFEDLLEDQKNYFIPASELAMRIKKNIVSIVLGRYRPFYGYYSEVSFATNKEKYIKCKPDDIIGMIQTLFTAC